MISLRSQSPTFFNTGQYLPVHCQSTYPRPSCQSTNTCPSNANSHPIHLANVCLYREQVIYWDPPLVSAEDDFTGQTVSHQTWNNAPIHQFITIPPVRCLSAISSGNPSIIDQSTTNIIPMLVNTSGKCVNIQGTRTLL